MNNEEQIISMLNRRETGRAVQLCREYTLNGFSDWFLPSKDELDEIYKNLKRNNIGGLSNNMYWSSSQYYYYDYGEYYVAWGQHFNNGNQNYFNRNNSLSVRAVRAF